MALLFLLAVLLAAPAVAAPAPGCGAASTPVDRLVCAAPELAVLDAAVRGAAGGDSDPRAWRDGRAAACPAIAAGGDRAHSLAIACLARLYHQRLAELNYAKNAAQWPRLPFRPRVLDGSGARLCETVQRAIVAGFLGTADRVDPLGEREIGFAPMKGLGKSAITVRRADIDVYNDGRRSPVLEWIEPAAGSHPETVEYRRYQSQDALLAAIGRGVEPLVESVRAAGAPVVDPARFPPPDPREPEPRAAFARSSVLPRDAAPHFFRYDDKTYLLAPLDPAAGVAGDLGVYRLYGPGRLHRVCLYAAHVPLAPAAADPGLAPPQIAALRHAAAPLLPTGEVCAAPADAARILADHAAWRPWALAWQGAPGGMPSPAQLALYLRNRALLGPEESRQYQVYFGARMEAIEALAPYYRHAFGLDADAAQKFAGLYADRVIAAGFEFDPDDHATVVLFSPGYAQLHVLAGAALAGDVAALKSGLGAHPRVAAATTRYGLGETLVSDALEHPAALALLLDLGLDPNATGASGRTPLMVAARLDLVEAAEILLAHGAKPDIGAGDAVAQSDRSGDPLCMAGAAAATDTPGRTALSYAAEDASLAMVRLLLDHGATAGARDSAGHRPADYLGRRRDNPAATRAIAALLGPR